jgi:hypothetical protein
LTVIANRTSLPVPGWGLSSAGKPERIEKVNNLLKALGAAIQPAIDYAEQKLESIGASVLSGIAAIFLHFTNQQRVIFANIAAFWQAHYHDAVAAGANPFDAIEKATTASLNEFAAEEGAEFRQEAMAFITLLSSAAAESQKALGDALKKA